MFASYPAPMEPTAMPRDLFRASLLLVLGEEPTYGYELPALHR